MASLLPLVQAELAVAEAESIQGGPEEMIPSKRVLVDLLERAGATFAEAFLALEIADQSKLTQLGSLKASLIAGGLAVGKYLLVQVNAWLAKPDPAAASKPPAALGS